MITETGGCSFYLLRNKSERFDVLKITIMENQILLNALNKNTYARADVLKYFQNIEGLFEPEKVLFDKFLPVIRNSKILDIGIGGGRTTRHLLEISDDYTGVDYVAEFAEDTGKKYPEARILCADARDMKEFGNETFDFVLFSYNGIDSVSHEDRLKILEEIYRVLKTGGIFMFSSHNRNYKNFNKLPWRQKIEFNADFFKFFAYCLYHLPNHFKMRKYEIFTEEYAMVNDGDYRYSLLLYYIAVDKQIKQLADVGFKDIEVYDMKGNMVKSHTSQHWLYYTARK